MSPKMVSQNLEQCRTKRTHLYIVDPVALSAAKKFEIRRLCNRERDNAEENRFVSEVIVQLLQEGRLVAAETTQGEGIRTATSAEIKGYRKPIEQVDGPMAITC